MSKIFRNIVFSLSLCFVQQFSIAQSITITQDKDSIMIGQPVMVTIAMPATNGKVFPILPDTFNGVEIIEKYAIDTVEKDGATFWEQKIAVSAYDSGTYKTPSGFDEANNAFIYNKTLNVGTVAVDTSATFMPEKETVDATLAWYESVWFFILCAVILLSIIAYFIYKKIAKKKKTNQTIENKVPEVVIPLDVKILDAIAQLKNKRLHENGEYKVFYSELSDIVRTYIEERFKFPARENTTQELLYTAKRTPLLKKHREPIKYILRKADLVKFAKADANIIEMQEALVQAESFVKATFRKEEEVRHE